MNQAVFSAEEDAFVVVLSEDCTGGVDLESLALEVEGLEGLVQHVDVPETDLAFAAAGDDLLLVGQEIDVVEGIGVASALQCALQERSLFGPAVPQHHLSRVQSSHHQVRVYLRHCARCDRRVTGQNVFYFGCRFQRPDQQQSCRVVYVSLRVRRVARNKLFSLHLFKSTFGIGYM